MKKLKAYLNTFWQLLKTDLYIYSKEFVSDLIDTTIWFVSITLVISYVYPALGMTENFGPFYAIGMFATLSFFEIFSTISTYLADLEGKRTITYHLTLPMPAAFVFIKMALSHAFKKAASGLIILPLCKLVLMDRISLLSISPIKFLLIYFSTHVFMGMFAVFMASFVPKMSKVRQVFIRTLLPLWMFSGVEYPLHILKSMAPNVAKLNLLNPLLYVYEGLRGAALNPAEYLPFYLCLSATWGFIIALAIIGIWKHKKRLDCI
jgi:ABC-type polysaccharide/polyol phosphate export permease